MMVGTRQLAVATWLMFWHTAAALTMCDPPDSESLAGHEGHILSPSYNGDESVYCKLHLAGIPKYSWIGVYVESINLKYSCGSYWNRNNYIAIGGTHSPYCNSVTSATYYYKSRNGPVAVEFYSRSFPSHHYFDLLYRVANVIYRPGRRNTQQIGINNKDNGYVVSHSRYGQDNYEWGINSALTLVNMSTNCIALNLRYLGMEKCDCCDKLQVSTVSETITICGEDSYRARYKDKWVTLCSATHRISFHFTTDYARGGDGFRIEYKVLEVDQSSTKAQLSITTENRHTSTILLPTTNSPQYSTLSTKAMTSLNSVSSVAVTRFTTTVPETAPSIAVTEIKLMTSGATHVPKNETKYLASVSSMPTLKDELYDIKPTDSSLISFRSNSIYIGVGVTACLILIVAVVIAVLFVRKRKSNLQQQKSPTSDSRGDQTLALSVFSGNQQGGPANQAYGAANQVFNTVEESEFPEYSYVDSGLSPPLKDNIYSFADEAADQQPLSQLTNQDTNQDNEYHLAEPMTGDVYENMDTVQRVESEKEIIEEYADIVAHTKLKGNPEVTEFVHNDLYGT